MTSLAPVIGSMLTRRSPARWGHGPATVLLQAALLVAAAVAAACGGGDEIGTREAFGGRVFELPVDLAPLPDGRYLVAQQTGEVLLVDASGAGGVLLDLSERVATGHEELGLMAVTADPSFDRTGAFWVHYIADGPLRNVVSRHTLSGREDVVLEVPQPFENHNGGALRFGPDGMLYVSIGDGGDAWDPLGHGQRPETLLSTILRLDVTSEPGRYAIPADNPFVVSSPVSAGVEAPARPEVWAYGVRNTWRFEFDEATGYLWSGDVGQDAAEEINLIRAGGNYGWSAFEGSDCRIESCAGVEAAPPLVEYTHAEGCAVVGGLVYRGEALPLHGEYLYGDLCAGWIRSVPADDLTSIPSGVSREAPREVAEVTPPIVGFARGHLGEVFVIRQGHPIVELVTD